jgi:MSHA biogenesis protein MshQ
VASASEPVSYSWGLSTTHTGATGGILSYSGVDNSNPIDVSASQATPSSTSHAAPTVTPTVASDMLVTVHEYASASSWTPPAGMTERVDIASRAASTSGITLEMNELQLGAAVATGAKTAIAASSADAGATVSIALRPAVTAPHHIRIEHDGSASNCAPEPITIKACANAACTAPHFTLSDVTGITLAATGSVTWSPVNTQTITAASGGANNGITLARSSAGAAALSISGTPSPAPNAAYECYNTATNTSGDCNLVYSDNLSFDVPNHTAGTRQAVTMTVCASSFASTTRSVKFWSTYVNPASGTLAGKVVAGSGNADCTSGYTALGTSNAAATSLSLAFGTGTTPQATFSLCYPDVGQVKLDAQYDGGSGNTPPDAGVQKLGNDSFIAKPDHFTVSAIKCTTVNAANCGAGALAMAPSGSNPSAADAAGGSFIRAGDTTQAAARFTATVTAKNALNATTPNFGVESAPGPKGIKLTSVLVAPVGGDPGLLTCKTSTTACALPGGAANFTSGATTITDLAWDDVGIIQLMPKLIDADYLGTGEVTTPTASANIGRFIPDHFEVNPDALNPILTRADLSQTVASATGTTAPATVIDVDDTTGFLVGSKVRIPGAGAGGNAFTATVTAVNAVGLTLTLDTAIGTTLDGGESVVEEWGSYMGEQMNANFVLSAMNAAGNITNNYQGDNAKLNLTAVGNPLGLGAMDTVGPTYNLALNIPQAPTGIFVNGSAAISAPMVVTRGTTPVGTYNAVKIGIAPASAEPDGVKMGAYDLSVAGGANDHTSIMDPLVQAAIQVRYGRLNISNAYGSELLALPVRMTAQYYSGTSWVTSAQDNLSAPGGTLTASAVAGTPLCTGLPTWIAPTNLMSGIGSFTLTPPLNGRCSADITLGLPSYLPNVGGRVTFGIYKSPLIYRRENY